MEQLTKRLMALCDELKSGGSVHHCALKAENSASLIGVLNTNKPSAKTACISEK